MRVKHVLLSHTSSYSVYKFINNIINNSLKTDNNNTKTKSET